MPSSATRTARQVCEILIERIRASPGMAGQVMDIHTACVHWADAGLGEPHWYVPVAAQREDYRLDVVRVFRQTQM